jgi:hypothetical protein
MNARSQRVCAWAGPVCAVTWVVGFFFLAGFIPPPSPSMDAHQIATMFAEHGGRIRAGLIIVGFGGAIYCPWAAAISVQLKRIEGRFSPMTYTQLGMGSVFVLIFIVPVMMWQAAAFRPMENIEITHRFNDMAWMLFIGPVCTIFVQGMAITIAILSDKSERPVLPRWLGWFNLWAQIIYLPGILIPYFKSGPLAWNGLLAFWIPVVVFTVWLCLITAMLLRAINEQERALTQGSAARPAAVAATAGGSQ